MAKTIHQWEDKFYTGQAGEFILDEYFKEDGLKINRVPVRQELKLGIDRWFVRKGYWLPVEYKTDFRAAETGNVFLETVKNCNGKGKAGWAKTSLAKRIYYYVPPFGKVYALRPEKWQEHPELLEHYRKAKAYNEGYAAEGYLIPFKQLSYFLYAKYLDVPAFKDEEALKQHFLDSGRKFRPPTKT